MFESTVVVMCSNDICFPKYLIEYLIWLYVKKSLRAYIII